MTRRAAIGLGTGLLVGLAGCTASGSNDQHATTSTTTETDVKSQTTSEQHAEEEGGKNTYMPTPVGDPAANQTVAMAMTVNGGHYFIPDIVWVKKGGTVTWENATGEHSATAYAASNDRPQRVPDGADGWDSGLVEDAGKTVTHTFDEPGVYDYYCKPHEALGMVGKVIVGGPTDLANEPALQPPQDLPGAGNTIMTKLTKRANDVLTEAKSNDHIQFTSDGDVNVVG
ncbi:MAG: plastocyanin/azurin family copper-binding protein [Haloarculaceae archaeon]